jgi:hypothetical protein
MKVVSNVHKLRIFFLSPSAPRNNVDEMSRAPAQRRISINNLFHGHTVMTVRNANSVLAVV